MARLVCSIPSSAGDMRMQPSKTATSTMALTSRHCVESLVMHPELMLQRWQGLFAIVPSSVGSRCMRPSKTAILAMASRLK